MKKYTIIGAVMTLAIVFTLTLAASTYANYAGNGNGFGQKPEITEEMKQVHEQIREAVENEDYEAFLALIAELPRGEEKVASMTEEKFNAMIARHAEGAKMGETREEAREALNNGDYETWKSLLEQMPNGSEMLAAIDSEDKFNQLVEAHQLMEEGRAKMEEAKTIMDELGLPRPQKRSGSGNGIGQGQKNFGQWRSQQNQ